MFYVYVIESKHANRKYIGSCEDLERRLWEHNQGYSRSTKPYRPWKRIHHEVFQTRPEAVQREMFFKSRFGRTALNRILARKSRLTTASAVVARPSAEG